MLVQAQTAMAAEARHALFPITRKRIFLAHAAVTALPRCAVERMQEALHAGMVDQQESESVFRAVLETRGVAAQLMGAKASEIALIGPTALGLNLVANGLSWEPGDEVVYYGDCYPANVYPWLALAERGVKPVRLQPERIGEITPELVLEAVTPRTRLVALASCHFLTGYRLDYRTIGAELKRRGILFCVDGIQSLGATPLDAEYFDVLSADSHKWLLGPLGAGIFYVKESVQQLIRPSLLGSWNVRSPQFIAQEEIVFETGGRRFECGSLMIHGILGMRASMELLLGVGLSAVTARILELAQLLAGHLRELGYEVLADRFPEVARSGIVTVRKEGADLTRIFEHLKANSVSATLRWDRAGRAHLRFSPHFYNNEEELERVAAILRAIA